MAIAVGISAAPISTVVWGQEEQLSGDALSVPSSLRAIDDTFYFADVSIGGRPIFQVGSVGDIDARERAATIDRRLASLVENADVIQPVTVHLNPDRTWATLQVNNRVLVTVTQQDAADFDVSIEDLARHWARQLGEALEKPPLAVDVTQLLGATIRALGRDTVQRLPSLLGATIVVLVTWGVAGGVRRGFFAWAQHTEGDRSAEILIARLGYGGVWVIGSVIALGVMGLEFGALLGAFGLTSVAIGFSLKDVLSNYISGVILLAARPFRQGDQVAIGGYEGTVSEIQLRATTLRTYDGRTVYIPNQEVFQASITNNTASPIRRSSVVVGIDYAADISTAIKIILEAIGTISSIQKREPFPPRVLVQELAASTVNLEVQFWVNSYRGEFLETTSMAAQAIKESLEAADIEMPTEIYTLLFRNVPKLQNETGITTSSNDDESRRLMSGPEI